MITTPRLLFHDGSVYALGDRYVVSRGTPMVRPVLAAIRAILARLLGRVLSTAIASAAMLRWQVVTRAVFERCHGLGVLFFLRKAPPAEAFPLPHELAVHG